MNSSMRFFILRSEGLEATAPDRGFDLLSSPKPLASTHCRTSIRK